jgi:AmmeMemoRadiSam system protein B
VSSDFCHWGSDFDYTFLPSVDGSINARIEALDREGMAKIATRDVAQFAKFIARTKDTICGELPIKIAMQCMAGTDWTVSWPHYSQSSVVRSARDTCVCYAAGIFRCR